MSTGKDVLQYRRQLNCTQKQLSEIIGVSQHTVYLWEWDRRQAPQPAIRLMRLLVALKLVGIVLNDLGAR